MTELSQKPQTASVPTVSPAALRRFGWFLIRLLIASLIVTSLILFARIPLEHLIAAGARNLLAIVSSPYYLKTIEFVDDGYGFSSWIGPLRGGFRLPSILFSFGFPIAYALALPGLSTRRYWTRLTGVVLISYFVCVIAVAVVSDARLTSSFLQLGITLQPEWRHTISRSVQSYLWMITVRLYPLVSVIVLAIISDQFRETQRGESSRAIRRFGQVVAVGLATLVTTTIVAEFVVDARTERVENESIRKYLASIEDLNPELGLGLTELGKFLEKQGDTKHAFEAYRHAVARLTGRPRKLARRARDRVQEEIKDDLLAKKHARESRRSAAP